MKLNNFINLKEIYFLIKENLLKNFLKKYDLKNNFDLNLRVENLKIR